MKCNVKECFREGEWVWNYDCFSDKPVCDIHKLDGDRHMITGEKYVENRPDAFKMDPSRK